MKIYKSTDRIPYKIGDLTIKLSPLSLDQKVQLGESMQKGSNGSLKSAMEGSVLALQFAIKEIQGLEDYELQFENGILTKECAEDLLNTPMTSQLITLCASFMNGIPSQLPEGVELVPNVIKPKKK